MCRFIACSLGPGNNDIITWNSLRLAIGDGGLWCSEIIVLRASCGTEIMGAREVVIKRESNHFRLRISGIQGFNVFSGDSGGLLIL